MSICIILRMNESPGWHDTEHRVLAAVERDRFSEHIWIAAKMLSPEILADDDFESAAAPFVLADKRAAHLRLGRGRRRIPR